jgi:hypothetical protein
MPNLCSDCRRYLYNYDSHVQHDDGTIYCPKCWFSLKYKQNITKLLGDIASELERSRTKHGNIRSAHEALGIIEEEWYECKLEIFRSKLDKDALKKELIQVAAMCLKTIEDCCA